VASRPLLLLLLTTYSLTLFTPAHADRGGYVIDRFHADLSIAKNSDLLVEERIEVEFTEPRHGIYRTIPVRYTDPKGYAYSFRFELLDVTDDMGRPHGAKVSQSGRHARVRIGRPDETVRGVVVYVIRYRVRGALGHFPEHDEVYWNATGNEWGVPIRQASATVRLPETVPSHSLDAAAFTGRFGGREQAAEITTRDGTVEFRATRELKALEGLTVAVAWPLGVVKAPGVVTKTARFFANNWVMLVPFAALAFLWRRYRRSGRDPDAAAPVMVRYEPPEGMTPAEIGALVDERVDVRDLTATIVDLAVRGHLVIRTEEDEKFFGLIKSEETVFERTGTSSDDLAPHEREVVAGLFEKKDRVKVSELRQKFYVHIPGIKRTVHERLVGSGHFASSPAAVRRKWTVIGIALGAVTFAIGMWWAQNRGGVLPNALVVPIGAAVATAALFLGFAPAMPRRTAKGVRMRSWALGFEEFVDRVEKDRLERLDPRTVFESLLPYAMALGVSGRWAEQFEGIYDDAQPSWYVGTHPGRAFSVRGFESSLDTAMTRAGESLAASPRSSGSSGVGGGGFSGGGGGGGGGGSW
jgi:uncharacterized membrane protein YgcG